LEQQTVWPNFRIWVYRTAVVLGKKQGAAKRDNFQWDVGLVVKPKPMHPSVHELLVNSEWSRRMGQL
jgi:hypothetical protein